MNLSKIYETESKYNVKILYLAKSGSYLYGMSDENSDVDYKGIFLPDKSTVLLGTNPDYIKLDTNTSNQPNTVDDVDCHLDSIHKWLNLLAKGETNAIDTLFSMWTDHSVIKDSNFVRTIKSHYSSLITRNPHAFVGYCISQTRKYNIRGERYKELIWFIKELDSYIDDFGHLRHHAEQAKLSSHGIDMYIHILLSELPTKHIRYVEAPAPHGTGGNWMYLEVLGRKFAPNVTLKYLLDHITKYRDDYGQRVKTGSTIDWKAMSHAVRVILEVEELLSTNFIKFPLKDRSYIYKVKRGQIPIDEVQQLLPGKIELVDNLLETATLPEKQNRLVVNNIILSLYGETNEPLRSTR